MSQISEEAGILSGSLYHHFATKEQILHELMKSFGEDLVDSYRQEALAQGAASDVIARILRRSFYELQSDHDRHMIMYNERRFFRRVPEFLYVAEYGREMNRILYGVLQQGVRDGTIRGDINLDLATSTIWRLTNALIESYQPNGRFSVDEIIELELSLLVDGLRPRG